ncbi:MAG TPA: 23S rRNA (uracil(1939)-C(5))-methyltransferase RlmD [Candidatus Dormibacteraeota bacterium]|nr:23S rRNA (uracil(1939)-C(5))-methyltransferase RlmD [Candidatus Dormibacteraeota bacterium]
MAEELRVPIEKLVYGGDGLGHAEGNTLFVPFVMPGELVRAEVKTRKKKTVWAKPLEIVEPAAGRVKAPCPHFGICGGCNYQHIDFAEQTRLKIGILRETLSRLGGISWAGEIAAHTAEPYGYRNRAQWAVRSGMPRALGYFLPESSVIMPVDTCLVLSPRLLETFNLLQEMARGGKLPSGVLEIEAFADSEDEKIALNIAFDAYPKPASELAEFFRTELPRIESLLLLDQQKERFELTGPGFVTHHAGGFSFRVSHLSFFQVNRFLIEKLLAAVTTGAKGALALDLYAGVGFFTLPLAKTFNKVISVDANLAATRDLYANAEMAGVEVTTFNEHTEDFLKKPQERPDFVVLDPPRSGLGTVAAGKLVELGAPEIIYLSCDPSTLARDLAILTGNSKRPAEITTAGPFYEITAIDMFDLFPQTFHLETLVRLRKLP